MTGRRVGVVLTLFAIVAAGGAGVLLWGLQQIPDFYEEVLAEQPNPETRKEAARKFVQSTVDLAENVKRSDMWSQEFSQAEVNAWLAEELQTKYAEIVPNGVSDPRVKFANDTILVGFHYADEKYTGIISLQLRPWVIEPNRLAVEIQSVKAGAVPLPMEEFLEMVDNGLAHDGWQVESGQVNGNQVLVLRIIPSEMDQPALETVKVAEGRMQVAGSRQAPTAEREIYQAPPRLADRSSAD